MDANRESVVKVHTPMYVDEIFHVMRISDHVSPKRCGGCKSYGNRGLLRTLPSTMYVSRVPAFTLAIRTEYGYSNLNLEAATRNCKFKYGEIRSGGGKCNPKRKTLGT